MQGTAGEEQNSHPDQSRIRGKITFLLWPVTVITVIRFFSIRAMVFAPLRVYINGTLVEDILRTWDTWSAYFSLNKCPLDPPNLALNETKRITLW